MVRVTGRSWDGGTSRRSWGEHTQWAVEAGGGPGKEPAAQCHVWEAGGLLVAPPPGEVGS